MKAKPFIIGGLVVGGLVAAYVAVRRYYLQQIDKLQNEMTYKLVGFRVGQLSMQLVEIFLTLRLHSTSTLDAEILDFSTDVLLENVKVAAIHLDKEKLSANMKAGGSKKNILPAKGYSDISIRVEVFPDEVKGNVVSILKTYVATKNLLVNLVNGKVKVKIGPVSKSVDFDYATNLKELMAP